MKITFAPSGNVIVDVDYTTDDIATATQFIKALRNDGTELSAKLARRQIEHKVEVDAAAEVDWRKAELSPALTEVYDYLLGLGPDENIRTADLALAFSMKTSTMDQRLRQLNKKGLAERVSRGLWRAVR